VSKIILIWKHEKQNIGYNSYGSHLCECTSIGTSMSSNDGGTNLPHEANKVFNYGYAFEHIVTLIHPLPSY